jgi:Protein phosphatase 2A regulatory B subunit (B56 family)
MPSDPLPHQKPTPHLPGEPATPPRSTTTLNNRLRQAPKDTIPMVGKPPRKQRSSRFHVTEKVEIERLPAFNGMDTLGCPVGTQGLPKFAEVAIHDRPELFIRKLHQCSVLFDFNDASAELRGKQIKAQTLHEMLDYITTQRGVITEPIYPEVVAMVCSKRALGRQSYALVLVCRKSLSFYTASGQSHWRCLRPGGRRASSRASLASSSNCLRVLPAFRREPRL